MFTLPDLPFPKGSLAPVMSEETFNYHYGKHHKAYVDKLNQLVANEPKYANATLEEVMKTSSGPIFNNAAQVWNHTFFWNCLSPEKKPPAADSKLAAAIQKEFGSMEAFQKAFAEKGVAQFGSGWVWLTRDKSGKLLIESTSNAANPLTEGRKPILVCDVWEHAYYIDYRNERPRFLQSFFQVVNWKFAEENFAKA